MRRAVVGILAVMLSAGVCAADTSAKSPAQTARESFSWTGCYAGGHIGGIQNRSLVTTYPQGAAVAFGGLPGIISSTYTYRASDSRVTGGVQFGCNIQFWEHFVSGVESSVSWKGLNETVGAFIPANAFYSNHRDSLTQSLQWYSTVRARIGVASGRTMIFAAGGLALGLVNASMALSIPSGVVAYAGSSAGDLSVGWTAGGGAEVALDHNWVFRGEYLYVDLGKVRFSGFAANPLVANDIWGADVRTKFHVFRLALSYRFASAPVPPHRAPGERRN